LNVWRYRKSSKWLLEVGKGRVKPHAAKYLLYKVQKVRNSRDNKDHFSIIFTYANVTKEHTCRPSIPMTKGKVHKHIQLQDTDQINAIHKEKRNMTPTYEPDDNPNGLEDSWYSVHQNVKRSIWHIHENQKGGSIYSYIQTETKPKNCSRSWFSGTWWCNDPSNIYKTFPSSTKIVRSPQIKFTKTTKHNTICRKEKEIKVK